MGAAGSINTASTENVEKLAAVLAEPLEERYLALVAEKELEIAGKDCTGENEINQKELVQLLVEKLKLKYPEVFAGIALAPTLIEVQEAASKQKGLSRSHSVILRRPSTQGSLIYGERNHGSGKLGSGGSSGTNKKESSVGGEVEVKTFDFNSLPRHSSPLRDLSDPKPLLKSSTVSVMNGGFNHHETQLRWHLDGHDLTRSSKGKARKVFAKTGDVRFAPVKVQKTLGTTDMTKEQTKRMERAEQRERIAQKRKQDQQLEQALMQNPESNPNLLVIDPKKGKISEKALQLIAEDSLLEQARMILPSGIEVPKKAVQLVGETYIFPEKAKKQLGDEMSREQRVAMLRDREASERKLQIQQQQELQDLLNALPDPSKKSFPDSKPSEKILAMLGDDDLDTFARDFVSGGSARSRKAIQLFGDSRVLPKKAADTLGSEMTQDQIRDMKSAEEKEFEEKQILLKSQMKNLLKSQATESQMANFAQTKGKSVRKIIQFHGEVNILPEKLKKTLGEEMSPDQRRKMLLAESPKQTTSSQSILARGLTMGMGAATAGLANKSQKAKTVDF